MNYSDINTSQMPVDFGTYVTYVTSVYEVLIPQTGTQFFMSCYTVPMFFL